MHPHEHEYQRAGACAYIAAWDVHRARLFGRCENTTGIQPFDRLVEQVMAVEPYRSARRVFWITDNGSSHRGEKAANRLRAAWPSLPLHRKQAVVSLLVEAVVIGPGIPGLNKFDSRRVTIRWKA